MRLNSYFIILLFVLILFSTLFLTGHQAADAAKEQQQTTGKEQKDIQVPPPPLNEDTFPCSMCHADMETNLERRELVDFHDDIVLKHDEENRWCMDCHDTENRYSAYNGADGDDLQKKIETKEKERRRGT